MKVKSVQPAPLDKNKNKKRKKSMPLVVNGRKLTLSHTKKSVIVRDEYGRFFGLCSLRELVEKCYQAIQKGEPFEISLCSVETLTVFDKQKVPEADAAKLEAQRL
jgi:hypothetical protein